MRSLQSRSPQYRKVKVGDKIGYWNLIGVPDRDISLGNMSGLVWGECGGNLVLTAKIERRFCCAIILYLLEHLTAMILCISSHFSSGFINSTRRVFGHFFLRML